MKAGAAFAAGAAAVTLIGGAYLIGLRHGGPSARPQLASDAVSAPLDGLGAGQGPLPYNNADIAAVAERYISHWGGDTCKDAHRSGATGAFNTVTTPIRKPDGTIDPKNGAGDGQCRAAVNCIVWIASNHQQWLGGGNGDYQKSFEALGAMEITSKSDLRRGDIIQAGNGTHTFIFERVDGADYYVIDSNSDYKETIVAPYRRVFTLGGDVRAWRLGTVEEAPTPQPNQPAATTTTQPAVIVLQGGQSGGALQPAGPVVQADPNVILQGGQTGVGSGGTAAPPAPAPPAPAPNPPAPDPPAPAPDPPAPDPPAMSWSETVGGPTHTWTNYSNAGGTEGPTIATGTTVQIACRLAGFAVANGNTWWYRIASPPWNGTFYASADAFYNNGQVSGPLLGTPYVDTTVQAC